MEQKKRGRKQKLKSRSSKRIKKNEETQIQALSEANLEQDNEVIDGEANEQKQIIEVNTSDIQIQEENDMEQIEMNNPEPLQMEILHKKGKRVWTRTQLKTSSNKDTLALATTESPHDANIPKDNFDVVEFVSEEKQPAKETSSAVSTQMNGQRAKLRSSQKNTCHVESRDIQMEEPPPISKSPIFAKALIEVFNPICTNLDSYEPTQMQEPGESKDQMKDEVATKSKTINKKDQSKCKRNGKHTMTRRSSGK